jgi:hypothetical protein
VTLPTGTPDDELPDPAWGVPKQMVHGSSPTPSEPSYEQRLWDDVAQATMVSIITKHKPTRIARDDDDYKLFPESAALFADAFMAERAKRMK